MCVWRACTTLLTLVTTLATCAATIAPPVEHHLQKYVTHVYQGSGDFMMHDLQPSYIPDKQCSGYISNVSCPASETLALEVLVHDAMRFPAVEVDASLSSATVYRQRARSGQCDGDAYVRVSVACEHMTPARARRSLRNALPPATQRD